jgi:hypothetical protein
MYVHLYVCVCVYMHVCMYVCIAELAVYRFHISYSVPDSVTVTFF